MIKNLIHIGYPKTATTTLQDRVLPELENINFLSISRKMVANLKESSFIEDYHIKRPTNDILISDKINCYSNEFLSMSIRNVFRNGKLIEVDFEEVAVSLKEFNLDLKKLEKYNYL